ncbi:MAG TPA: caspase family protein [Bryobacteraceae bacterium]|nr:caspase family protein [Bryobacteraceae bacterium]
MKRYLAERKIGIVLPLVCLCFLQTGTAEPPPHPFPNLILEKRRVALVIGNAAYRRQPVLRNPVHDAEDMKISLEKLGFDVTIGTDLGYRDMWDRIRRFISTVRAGDVVLFYYSGHGSQVNGENLLAPVDLPTILSEPTMGQMNVRFDEVQNLLEQSPASLSILIMDACRNNMFHGKSLSRGLAPAVPGLGSYVAFSASPGQTADDNPSERNGLFTKYLLEDLKQPPPLSQLFRGVRDSVYQASGTAQKPYLVDQVIGDFWFTRPASASSQAPAAPPLPPPSSQAKAEETLEEGLRLYRQKQCGQARELFERATRQDPDNPFAQNALGMAYVCQNQFAAAIPHFNLAIVTKPDLAAAYRNRGTTYQTTGKYELAVEDFTWAIEEDDADAVSYTQRGASHFALREYDEARADFNRAIQINPSAADAYFGRGQLYEREHKYRQAFDDYTAALTRNANLAAAQKSLDALRPRMGR